MTTIQVESQLHFDDLLRSLEQLNSDELEQLTRHAARLQARRRAPSLTQAETELLMKINAGVVPADVKERCSVLTALARARTLSAEEHAELTDLVDQIEELNAERIGYLAQLAQLRGVSLAEIMNTLQIAPLSYG